MKYNKLVRDKIPELIQKDGKKVVTTILDAVDYKRALHEKLQEEMDEYLVNEEMEELADILEVIYAIGLEKGVTAESLEKMRLKKRKERGGFEKKISLTLET